MEVASQGSTRAIIDGKMAFTQQQSIEAASRSRFSRSLLNLLGGKLLLKDLHKSRNLDDRCSLTPTSG